MKLKFFLISIAFSMFALLLSACSGSAFNPAGWTGITLDKNIAYVARNQFVYAVDLQKCSQIWKYPEKSDKRTFFSAPTLASNQLLVGSYDNNLYSLDPATGKDLTTGSIWFPTKGHVIASPVVISSTVFLAGSDSRLYILNLKGNYQRAILTDGALWSAPAYDGKTQKLYQASMDHHVYAISANSTKTTWDWTSEDLGGSILDSPTIGPDGTIYVGTFGSEIVAIGGAHGNILWRIKTDGGVWAAPALDNDHLYFGDMNDNMVAINLPDHSIAWKKQADELVTGKPLVTKDAIYFASGAGTVYALDRNGNQLWKNTIGGNIYNSPVEFTNPDGTVSVLVAPQNTDAILTLINPNGGVTCSFIPPK